MPKLTKEQFYQAVAQYVVDWGDDEEHLIATMILLHCYNVAVGGDIQLSDGDGSRVVCATTRRHAAEIIANCDRHKRRDKHPRTYQYWNEQWQIAPFELVSSITAEWQARVNDVIEWLTVGGIITGATADD